MSDQPVTTSVLASVLPWWSCLGAASCSLYLCLKPPVLGGGLCGAFGVRAAGGLSGGFACGQSSRARRGFAALLALALVVLGLCVLRRDSRLSGVGGRVVAGLVVDGGALIEVVESVPRDHRAEQPNRFVRLFGHAPSHATVVNDELVQISRGPSRRRGRGQDRRPRRCPVSMCPRRGVRAQAPRPRKRQPTLVRGVAPLGGAPPGARRARGTSRKRFLK